MDEQWYYNEQCLLWPLWPASQQERHCRFWLMTLALCSYLFSTLLCIALNLEQIYKCFWRLMRIDLCLTGSLCQLGTGESVLVVVVWEHGVQRVSEIITTCVFAIMDMFYGTKFNISMPECLPLCYNWQTKSACVYNIGLEWVKLLVLFWKSNRRMI